MGILVVELSTFSMVISGEGEVAATTGVSVVSGGVPAIGTLFGVGWVLQPARRIRKTKGRIIR
jgi:hypothetical protein